MRGAGGFGGFRAASVGQAVGVAGLAAAPALGRRGHRIGTRALQSNVVRTGGYFEIGHSNVAPDQRGEAVQEQRHVGHGVGDALGAEGKAFAHALGMGRGEHHLEADGEDRQAAQGEVVGDSGVGEEVCRGVVHEGHVGADRNIVKTRSLPVIAGRVPAIHGWAWGEGGHAPLVRRTPGLWAA